MTEQESTGQELVTEATRFVSHAIAIAVGLVLMVVGIAMGVTLVLLPVGIPLGFVGLFFLVWGLFGWSREKRTSDQPAGPDSLQEMK